MSSTPKELQADQSIPSPFVTMWFETTLGVRYTFPDMQTNHVDAAHQQLCGDFDRITCINISEAVLVVPKRILVKAGVGERCFWENNAD